MLSIAQAREVATKEWEENFPDEHAKLEKLKSEGRNQAMAATEALGKHPLSVADFSMSHISICTAFMISGWEMGKQEQKEKDQWIKFRTEQLVKDSMKPKEQK